MIFPQKIQIKLSIFQKLFRFFHFLLFLISDQTARPMASPVPPWSWYGPGTTPGHRVDQEESHVVICSTLPYTDDRYTQMIFKDLVDPAIPG